MRTIIIAAIVVALSGCTMARQKFSETITDETGAVTTTEYSANQTVPPLGKMNDGMHDFSYRYGGAENVIQTGQGIQGVDNTEMSIIAPLLVELVKALVQMQQPAPVPMPVE